MRRDSKKAFFVIFGLLLFYVQVKLLGDAVQRSDLPHCVDYPIYFLLEAEPAGGAAQGCY